jgi:hypothetical protein
MAQPFPYDTFIAYFPEFEETERKTVVSCGMRAMLHISHSVHGIPMQAEFREYGQCLMAAHILYLQTRSDENGNGDPSLSDMAGVTYKATVGSVQIENTKPNAFLQDDWQFWLSQTKYGRELLAYLSTQAQPIFLNTKKDSVRDLP